MPLIIRDGRILGGTPPALPRADVRVDEDRIYARAQAADRQRAQGWAFAEQLMPHVGLACRAVVATPLDIKRYAATPPPRA